MPTTRRSTKRQTRLAFPPMISSPPQVGDNSLNGPNIISQNGSERKTRSSGKHGTQLPLIFENSRVTKGRGLPTPNASSQSTALAALEDRESTSSSDSSQSPQPASMRRKNATDMFTKPVTPRKAELTSPITPSSKTPKRNRPNPLFTPSKRRKSGLDNGTGENHRTESLQGLTLGSPGNGPENDSESDIAVIGSRRLRSENQSAIAGLYSESEDQNSDQTLPKPVRSRSHIPPQGTMVNADLNGKLAIPAQEKSITLSDEDSDVAPITPRRRLKRRSQAHHLSNDSDEEPEVSEDDDDMPVPSSRVKARDDEVLEDAEDLKDTEVRDSRTRGRDHRVTKQDPRKKGLEALKARRAGKKGPSALSDSESASETAEDDVVDEPSERRSRLRLDRRNADDGEWIDGDEDEEDWIIEDEDEGEQADWRAEMPLKYTSHAHLPAKDQFKRVVEWMIQKKLNPAFNREDEVYDIAFRKTDDEAKGYAGSKFSSSVWRPLFFRALKARPDFNDARIEGEALPGGCEACGRSNHKASWTITFSGEAYHPKTLEPLKDMDEDEDDDDDGDSADAGSLDIDGNQLPTQQFEFRIGRHCKSNAFIAHSLLHWVWHLNDWVLQWLDSQGYLAPERLVEREAWSVKKRGTFANGVVDEMDQEGELKALRRDFKNRIEEASSKKVAAFGRADEVER